MSSIYIYAIVFLCSFLVTFVSVKVVLRVSLKHRIGQKILEEGPVWHKEKEGTPTMGGIAFMAALIPSFLAFLLLAKQEGGNLLPLINIIIFAMLNSSIGLLDDCLKIKNDRNKGLTAPVKFTLQSIAAVTFIVLMEKTVGISTILKIPFLSISFDFGIFYYLLAYLILCGFVNAVNLTDGLDGLASSVMIPVSLLFSVVGLFLYEDLSFSYIGAMLFGLIVAFLIFNRHPAKIFMGDTGSLFLGGVLAGTALYMGNLLLILFFGFVYLCEAASVIIQVVYFKVSKGKRAFKMAPLHHHFEKCGWSEKKIVTVFTLVSSLFCAIALWEISL